MTDLDEAVRWLRESREPDVMIAVAATLDHRQCGTIAELARVHPQTVLALYDTVTEMLEALPVEDWSE